MLWTLQGRFNVHHVYKSPLRKQGREETTKTAAGSIETNVPRQNVLVVQWWKESEGRQPVIELSQWSLSVERTD